MGCMKFISSNSKQDILELLSDASDIKNRNNYSYAGNWKKKSISDHRTVKIEIECWTR